MEKDQLLDIDPGNDIDDSDNLYSEDLSYNDFGGGFGADYTPMEKHNDLLKDLTNFDEFLRDTINAWLGITWNEKEKKYTRDPYINPIMNMTGAAWCVSFLKTYARKNNIITNVSKDDYLNIIEDVIETVWYNVGTRAEEFGITNNGDIKRVCEEMQHSIELVLMGAGDGKYNQLLTSTTQRAETVNLTQPVSQNPRNNVGRAGKFMNWLRGK